jgi:hypothetical protein
MAVVVVAAVAHDYVRATTRPAHPPAHAGDGVEQRDELGDVVAVAAREADGERDAARDGQEVVLGARATTIDGAGARLEPPFSARTWLESTTARDQSISPAACRRASRSSCRADHTPALERFRA